MRTLWRGSQSHWVEQEGGCSRLLRLLKHLGKWEARHPEAVQVQFSHWPMDWKHNQLNLQPTPVGHKPRNRSTMWSNHIKKREVICDINYCPTLSSAFKTHFMKSYRGRLRLINQYSPDQQTSASQFDGPSIRTTIRSESKTFSPCIPILTYLHDNYFSPSSRSYSHTYTVILFVCLCWI